MINEDTLKGLKDLREFLRLEIVELNKAIKTLERMSDDASSREEIER